MTVGSSRVTLQESPGYHADLMRKSVIYVIFVLTAFTEQLHRVGGPLCFTMSGAHLVSSTLV